jgi:hypothetical protein
MRNPGWSESVQVFPRRSAIGRDVGRQASMRCAGAARSQLTSETQRSRPSAKERAPAPAHGSASPRPSRSPHLPGSVSFAPGGSCAICGSVETAYARPPYDVAITTLADIGTFGISPIDVFAPRGLTP